MGFLLSQIAFIAVLLPIFLISKIWFMMGVVMLINLNFNIIKIFNKIINDDNEENQIKQLFSLLKYFGLFFFVILPIIIFTFEYWWMAGLVTIAYLIFVNSIVYEIGSEQISENTWNGWNKFLNGVSTVMIWMIGIGFVGLVIYSYSV